MDDIKVDRINTQLSAARAVLLASGKSPRQLGNESKQRVIDWIYLWGYTSAAIAQLLLDRTSAGYLQKLARQDLLAATKTKSGVPALFFTLTQLGLHEAERHADRLCRYIEIDQYKVDQAKIRHYLIAQVATINAIRSGLVARFETERMFANDGDKLGVKRPDVVWVTPAGLRLGVEVELSAKWERLLDLFVLGIARALKSDGNDKPTYNRFIIISDSPAIIRRYSAAMQPGETLSIWHKNGRGHWEVERSINVPDWLISKVDFQLIES